MGKWESPSLPSSRQCPRRERKTIGPMRKTDYLRPMGTLTSWRVGAAIFLASFALACGTREPLSGGGGADPPWKSLSRL